MTAITQLDIVALATFAAAWRRRAAFGETTARPAARALEIELQRRLGEPVPIQPEWHIETLEADVARPTRSFEGMTNFHRMYRVDARKDPLIPRS